MPRKNFEFKFPFEPPKEDLRKVVVTASGARCYIYDTCVVTDPEERKKIERNIANIIIERDRREFLKRQEEQRA